MIESEKSGIAFSVHPVTQDKNQLIIEAGFGLGEAIVSGQITPDSYILEKQPRRVIDKNIQTQSKGLYRAENGGNEWRDIPKEKGATQVLSDREILELSKIILQIESHYDFPCDIEWAQEKEKFYIVQSRPITTLSDKPKEEIGYKLVLIGKRIVDRFHAELRVNAWTEGLQNEIGMSYQKIVINSDGEYYVDEQSEEKLRNILAEKNFDDFSNYATKMAGFKGNNFSNLFVYFLLARCIAENIYQNSTEKEKKEIEAWRNNESLFRSLDEYLKVKKIDSENVNEWSLIFENKKGIRFVDYVERPLVFEKSITRDWPLFIVEMLHKGFTDEFQKQIGFRYSEVLFDIYADHLDIYRISAEHIEKMREFILLRLAGDSKFVSKCSKSLFQYYENFLNLISIADKSDLSKVSDKELADLLKKFINAHTKLEPTFVINFWFPIQMENFPEKTKWEKEIAIAAKTRTETEKVGPEGDRIARRFAQEVSKRMFGDEKYSKFISLSEAYDFLLNGKLPNVNEIKKRLNGFVFGAKGIQFTSVDKYAELEGYEVKRIEVEEDKIIKGNVAYPGIVRGHVRIVISKEKIGIVEEGDILVTAMTTPEFMPALEKAVAFVTDEGGITSHAAIVSRELKKPCIIGTKVATQVLKDGNLVEVDANAGIVRILQ